MPTHEYSEGDVLRSSAMVGSAVATIYLEGLISDSAVDRLRSLPFDPRLPGKLLSQD